MNTVVINSFIKDIKSSRLTSSQLRKLRAAVQDIQDSSLEELRKKDKIYKIGPLQSIESGDCYIYRISLRDRVVFIEKDNKRVILDYVSADEIRKLRNRLVHSTVQSESSIK